MDMNEHQSHSQESLLAFQTERIKQLENMLLQAKGKDSFLEQELCNSKSSPVEFQFQVSLDEEHVFLKLLQKGKTYDLGERVHHYLLLTLARQRLQDSQKGGDPYSHGWMDLETLSSMLGLDRPHINIQIHRVKKQIEEVFPQGNICVERRVGEIRFASSHFQILQGSTLVGRNGVN